MLQMEFFGDHKKLVYNHENEWLRLSCRKTLFWEAEDKEENIWNIGNAISIGIKIAKNLDTPNVAKRQELNFSKNEGSDQNIFVMLS